MALTYEELGALMQDAAFRSRIKVSCLSFANYILSEGAATPAHNTRVKWAQATYQNPDQAAYQVQPPTCMEDAVKQSGAAVTDAQLQTAVETAINKLI